jgi:hypothetical protein
MLETNVRYQHICSFQCEQWRFSPLHKIFMSYLILERRTVEPGSVHLRTLCAVELLSDKLLGFDIICFPLRPNPTLVLSVSSFEIDIFYLQKPQN